MSVPANLPSISAQLSPELLARVKEISIRDRDNSAFARATLQLILMIEARNVIINQLRDRADEVVDEKTISDWVDAEYKARVLGLDRQ